MRKDRKKMELIKTEDLYENQSFVIIEAVFEDPETDTKMVEISLGIKDDKGDITEIRTIHKQLC